MRRETINLIVEQQIVYGDTKEVDRYEHQTEGILLELQTFSKITYQDARKQEVSVKWSEMSETDEWEIEIVQPSYTLKFRLDEATSTFYQTPQGFWELTVITKNIQFSFGQLTPTTNSRELLLDYDLYKEKELLGNYRFRLIYPA